ncbi:MAG: nucleotide pyrophosphohydrolase [Archaeoglobaceae archaeon]
MDLESILEDLRQFRDKRDWLKFHTPKNLAISIAIEACELLELFQWTRDLEEEKNVLEKKSSEIADEVADIFIYLLFLCDIAGLDLEKAVREKIARNEERFSAEVSFEKR